MGAKWWALMKADKKVSTIHWDGHSACITEKAGGMVHMTCLVSMKDGPMAQENS